MCDAASFLARIVAAFSKSPNVGSYSGRSWPINVRAADWAVSLLEARVPARILDLACGAGAVTVALALQGFDVTGIDCTPAQLDVARRMSRRKHASVRWLCEDMRLLRYENEFDFVCLRDVIFGVFETEQEHRELIRRITMALKPGGRFLLEVYNRDFALKHGVENTFFYNADRDRFLPQDPSRTLLTAGLYLWSQGELAQMLASQGLRVVRMDGWKHDHDPPPPPWRADMIVAQKELACV
jgi:SAM-dependent methyltransferase